MTTMIERLARAITDELARQDGYDAPSWKFEDGLKIAWLDQGEVDMGLVARAALIAMLESSSHLIGAGGEAIEKAPIDDDDIELARAAFTAMIQAALDEKEG